MTTKHNAEDTICPVARGLNVVGDKWSVLILRELFMGNQRFDGLQAQTGATPQMLASRLKKLTQAAVIERRLYQARPARYEYVLTEMGKGYFPILNGMRAWGETWCKPDATARAVDYVHVPCGEDPGLGPVCQHCHAEIRLQDLEMRLSSGFKDERDKRSLQHAG